VRVSRIVIGLAFAVAAAAPAQAQFTAVVVPPKKPKAEAVAEGKAANAEQTKADTALKARMTDMKAWVDSAAVAVKVATPAASDSALRADSAAPTPVRPTETRSAAGDVETFRQGAPAPNTATPLPLLALLGAGSMAAGALLRRRRK
jgi:LPXTG-motif cell wall-anchored protein